MVILKQSAVRIAKAFSLLLLAALVLTLLAPPASTGAPASANTNKPSAGQLPKASTRKLPSVGVQFHGTWSNYTDAGRAKVLDRLKSMGAKWVRIDIGWGMIQPNNEAIDVNSWGVQHVNKSISMAHARGLKVLGTFWLTPGWANNNRGERVGPSNPQDYAKALKWASNHWQGKVQAWEVWNEPNSSDFLVGANPNEYTKLLCASEKALPDGKNNPKVVFGGTVYNDTSWIAKTYRAGAKGCFDIMATHPYVAPADKGPAYTSGKSTLWEFNHLRQVRKLMLRYHDRKPIWATEMGWSSHRNVGGEGNWELGVSERKQAQYSVQALKILRAKHPYVTNVFFYNERAKPGENVHQRGYGLMTEDFKPKPVYRALKRLLK